MAASEMPNGLESEDYESLYVAMSENRARLSYWVNRIYRSQGDRDPLFMEMPLSPRFQSPSVRWIHPIMSMRYIVLELWNFDKLYNYSYKKIAEKLDPADPGGLHQIINKNPEMTQLIYTMRNEFGAHSTWTFDSAIEKITKEGLHNLVFYACAVIMFQDAVFRTILKRYHKPKTIKDDSISITLNLRSADDLQSLKEQYSNVNILNCAPVDADKYALMQESLLCLTILYTGFEECALGRKKKTLNSFKQFNIEIHNLKYIILEMCNIIKAFRAMKVTMTYGSTLKKFTPEFMKKEQQYCDIRNDYGGHTRLDKISSLTQLQKDHASLISGIARDLQEVCVLSHKLDDIFPDLQSREIRPMTESEMIGIEQKLENICIASHKFYDWQFVDHTAEQKRRDEEERVKRELGLT